MDLISSESAGGREDDMSNFATVSHNFSLKKGPTGLDPQVWPYERASRLRATSLALKKG